MRRWPALTIAAILGIRWTRIEHNAYVIRMPDWTIRLGDKRMRQLAANVAAALSKRPVWSYAKASARWTSACDEFRNTWRGEQRPK